MRNRQAESPCLTSWPGNGKGRFQKRLDGKIRRVLCQIALSESLIILSICIQGILAGLAIAIIRRLDRLPAPKKKAARKPARRAYPEARNASEVLNASVDFQKIKTAEIEIPVIAADVLTYEGGELGDSYPERTRLYYAPEALSDPEYLQTVLRSPLQIQTHEKNTTEFNRGVDGWPLTVEWDEAEQRVKVMGVLHGEENVKYAESNQNKPGFGTSAFISFLKIDRTPGTSPDGKPYDAVVRKAVNNHIAILPNVRDKKNVILAMNAVEGENGLRDKIAQEKKDKALTEKKMQAWKDAQKGGKSYEDRLKEMGIENAMETETTNSEDSLLAEARALLEKNASVQNRETTMAMNESTNAENAGLRDAIRAKLQDEQDQRDERAAELKKQKQESKAKNETEGKRMPIDKEDFKNAMNEYEAGKKEEEEAANKIKNAVLEDLKKEGEAKDSKNSDEPVKEKEVENAEEKKDDGEASNAYPSEAMVKDFSDALGVTFKTTPTLKALAAVSGVEGKTTAELIQALNAKRETFKTKVEAVNAVTHSGMKSVDELLRTI